LVHLYYFTEEKNAEGDITTSTQDGRSNTRGCIPCRNKVLLLQNTKTRS